MSESGGPRSDPSPSFVDSLGALARTFAGAQDQDTLLAEVTEQLSDLLDLTATAAVLAPQDGTPMVTVRPSQRDAVGLLVMPPMVDPVLAPTLTGTVVCVPDLVVAGHDHWKDRSVSANGDRIQALAGVPVRQRDTAVGALYLFSAYAREWPETTMSLAQTFADLTGTYLALMHTVQERSAVAGQLQTALDSRVAIEQAKGVLAASLGITVDQAFDRIRDHARRERATISDVADAVVTAGLRP